MREKLGKGSLNATGLSLRARAELSVFIAALFVSSLIPRPSSILYAADWPMFMGDERRTGWAREQAYPPLTKAWEFQAGGELLSSPVISGGVAYIGTASGTIYARNARTGAAVWQYAAGGAVGASPTVHGDRVFVPSMDGYLYAPDRLSGSLAWKAALGSSSMSSPLVYGGRVFVGAGMPGKELRVFDAATGAQLAALPANQPVDSAPSAHGGAVYYGSNDGRVYAVGADTYAALWAAPGHYQTVGSFGTNSVAVSSGALYAIPGRDEDRVIKLDALTGIQLYASDPIEATDSWQQAGSPVAAGGRLYFAAGATAISLYALAAQDLQAPSPAWPSAPSLGPVTGMGVISSPAMANEVIYAATTDGRLVAVSSAGASLAADVDVSSPARASPAVSNGMVLVATSGGKLIGYSAAKAAALSSPAKDSVVNGVVEVKGWLVNAALSGYTLDYGSGEEPASWTNMVSSATAAAVEGGTLASWDTSALANGVYTLRLTALESPASGTDCTARLTLRVNAAPQPPSALAAADVPGDGGNAIALSWTPSATAGVSYRIYRDGGEGFSLLASTGAGAQGYTDASAVTGTTFTYRVRSWDGWLESGDSDSASARAVNDTGDSAAPGAVADLRGADGPLPGMAILYWTAPGDDGDLGTASRYQIRYTSAPGYDWNDFNGAALYASTRSVDGPAGIPEAEEAHGLFGGVTYYFALKAQDEVPNTGPLSNIATYCVVLDRVPPAPPTGLSAADTPWDSGGSLTLSWTPSPDDAADTADVYGYGIYRRLQGGAYVPGEPYARAAKGSSSYVDGGAAAGERYYYAVAAYDSTNDSALSNEAWGVSADNWRFFDSAQGAAVRLPDGTEILIPGDATQASYYSLMVMKLDPVTYQPLFRLKANTAANPTGITYAVRFQNASVRLLKPARVTLPYTDAAAAGMEQENLRMYALSGGAWSLLNTSSVDTAAKKVSAETLQFSTFTIMEYVPSTLSLNDASVYTYPNPARGDTVTFKFYLPEKAYVAVDVYNVAGEKVARLEKANCPAGIVSEIAWSVKNVASGVYQYRLEARSASGTKSIMKRLAVIH